MDKKVLKSRVFIGAVITGVCSIAGALGFQILTPEQQATIINAITIIAALF